MLLFEFHYIIIWGGNSEVGVLNYIAQDGTKYSHFKQFVPKGYYHANESFCSQEEADKLKNSYANIAIGVWMVNRRNCKVVQYFRFLEARKARRKARIQQERTKKGNKKNKNSNKNTLTRPKVAKSNKI